MHQVSITVLLAFLAFSNDRLSYVLPCVGIAWANSLSNVYKLGITFMVFLDTNDSSADGEIPTP